MDIKLKRPILIGGVGLSMALWFWESIQQEMGQLSELTMMGAIALTGLWWFKQKAAKTLNWPGTEPVDKEKVEKAIAKINGAINQLEAEKQDVSTWRQGVEQLTAELDRKEISLAVTGGKSVGKTSLIQGLDSSWEIQETPALFVVDDGETAAEEILSNSDLVVFVTAGDLTDSEFQTLQQLAAVHQRTVLAFNKQDQYLPEEQPVILEQLRQRTAGILESKDVVAIAASPDAMKVRKHSEDGEVSEWMENQQPQIAPLTERLSHILETEAQQLVWATTMRQADILKGEVKEVLNGLRRDRALPIIEQYQYIAAAAAFANPIPTLDLLATGAINGQLVMDLGAVYQQKFDLDRAQKAAGTIGSLMLKLGLVELTTQTISGILKSHAVTYVAGGVAQGVSAAYLTRLAGLSLIEYFQAQDLTVEEGFNLDKLGETLKNVFQQNNRMAFFQGFVKQVAGRLVPVEPKLAEKAVS
ncbi:MAG: YcjF family protein [Hormoscilla sp.]